MLTQSGHKPTRLRQADLRIVVRAGGQALRRGASFIRRQLLGTITEVQTREPMVALTFDDGPHPIWTPQLLETLESYRAHATFFVVGEVAARQPTLLQRMADAGHAIGNHSWSHPSFPQITHRQRIREMRACEEVIGRYNATKLFRPPYGNQVLASRLDALWRGYQVVGWSVIGCDWEGDSAQEIFQRVTRDLRPGSIVLLHDSLYTVQDDRWASREATLEAVRMLLGTYSKAYRFVSVPELLRHGSAVRDWWDQPGDTSYLGQLRRIGD